jgi:DNA polymerase-4
LFDEMWDGAPVRLLGIRVSKLVANTAPTQLNLFDYQQTAPESEKQKKLNTALDSLRAKYGKDIIKRGSLLDSPDEYKS